MNIRDGLFYAETHEWVKFSGKGTALIGLSEHASESLGDIAFVNLCEEGDYVTVGETLGDIESIKAVSDLYAPVSGKVIAVNQDVIDSPELINSDPYAAWLIKIDCDDENKDLLMNKNQYKAFLETQSK